MNASDGERGVALPERAGVDPVMADRRGRGTFAAAGLFATPIDLARKTEVKADLIHRRWKLPNASKRPHRHMVEADGRRDGAVLAASHAPCRAEALTRRCGA